MNKHLEKRCPVCGEKVIGRIDKKFCCDGCRTHANNLRHREQIRISRRRDDVGRIEKDLVTLSGEGGGRYLKIIAAVTLFCKIMYKFGHQNKQT